MPKKRIEISVWSQEGRIGYVDAQLDDKALAEISTVVNKHCKTSVLTVKSAADAKEQKAGE